MVMETKKDALTLKCQCVLLTTASGVTGPINSSEQYIDNSVQHQYKILTIICQEKNKKSARVLRKHALLLKSMNDISDTENKGLLRVPKIPGTISWIIEL